MKSLEGLLGDDAKSFGDSLREYPDRCVRPRRDRAQEELPFATVSVPWFREGRRLQSNAIRPGSFLQYAAADYYIQDAGSLLPLALADIQPGDMVCDVCAAPGGKSTAIAERLGPEGVLLANEVIRSRVDVLKYSLARTGRSNHVVSNLDPKDLAKRFAGSFDKVLLDVPCSGQSLLSKSKQSETAFSSKQVDLCAARAQRILQQSISLLRPGGVLIFSTCTFAIEENESQIEWLHQQYPDIWQPVEMESLRPWESPLGPGCYRLWPHRDGCAGGFAAALRMRHDRIQPASGLEAPGEAKLPRVGEARSQRREKRQHEDTHRGLREERHQREKIETMLAALGTIHGTLRWHGGMYVLVESGLDTWLDGRDEADGWDTTGLNVAPAVVCTGKQIVPSHALALMSRTLFEPHGVLPLTDSLAVRVMQGESIALCDTPWIEGSGGSRGGADWVVADWRDRPLGWMKRSAGRWNNHLPAWSRVNRAVWSSEEEST
jgi:16S rRNA C967 or C1407 C5-methylase (RsmB/RsmF family)